MTQLRQAILCMVPLMAGAVMPGCATYTGGSQSAPALPNQPREEDAHYYGEVALPDLTLRLRPLNARHQLWWGLFVPVMLGSRYAERANEPFRIFIEMLPGRGALTWTPEATRLTLNQQDYSPTGLIRSDASWRVVAPETQWGTPSERENFLFSTTESDTHCRSFSLGGGPAVLPTLRRREDITDGMCFVLEFPVTTPAPRQVFSVAVRGVTSGNRPISIPEIHFSRAPIRQFELHDD